MRIGHILRVGFGIGLVLTAAAIYAPALLGTESAEAIINAQTIAILSPIEGIAVGNALAPGRIVRGGEELAEIRNAAIDQTFLTQLRGEAETLRERIRGAAPLQAQLQAHADRLRDERRRAESATVARLKIVANEAEAASRAAAAIATQADNEVTRKRALLSHGWIAQAALDKAMTTADQAHAEADRARLAAERQHHDVASGRDGVAVAEQPDISYAVHHLDDIELRQAELAAQLQEETARLAEIERNLPVEEARIAKRSVAHLTAPVTAIVWRPMTFAGGWVAPDRPVTTLIDCSQRIIQAKLPGRKFDEVQQGTTARLKILGSTHAYEAVVLDKRGMGASELGDRFAAPVPTVSKDEFLVTLTLADPAGLSDGNAFCNVGRRVEVVFESPLGALDRFIASAQGWVGIGRAAALARADTATGPGHDAGPTAD